MAEKLKNPSKIGGQAVLEGIMMRCEDRYSVAVRKPDQTIALDVHENYTGVGKGKKFTKLPFIRGIFAFIDSMVLGIKTLSYSASFYDEETEEDTSETEEPDGFFEKIFGEKAESVVMSLTVFVSILISIGLFMILPYFIADFLFRQKLGLIGGRAVSVVEAFVKLGLFLFYLWFVSLMKDIKRTYMYHGAEHKCINCIESGKILNVENVRGSSRFHKRCGTSFMFLVMIISIAFFVCIRSDYIVVQYLLRIALMPVIAGVSYEFIRIAGNSDSLFVRIISAPGKALQHLTTREPDDSMIEVAIEAVEAVYDWREYLRENGVKLEDEEV